MSISILNLGLGTFQFFNFSSLNYLSLNIPSIEDQDANQNHEMPFSDSEKPVESSEDNYEDEGKEIEALVHELEQASSATDKTHSQKFLALFSNPFYSSITPPPERFC